MSVDTVGRWIKSVMAAAGIDTTVFGAHSVRGASASAARSVNVPLDAVLQAGDWSGLRSFSRHYQRDSPNLPSCQVANALLQSIQ